MTEEQHAQGDGSAGREAAGNAQFAIQKIYLKDASFESPNSPLVFTQQWTPEVDLHLSSGAETLGEGTYEVVLSVTATTKLSDKTAFLIEVKQAGIFTLQGFSERDLGAMLGSYCPTLLFPFAREAVADLVSKGGFPQLLLAPVNFDALYAQHLQESPSQEAAQPTQKQH